MFPKDLTRRRRHFLPRPGHMDLVAAAVAYAQYAHEFERLKYVEGTYYTHVKGVSERLHTSEEKVVALLHDVVENRIEDELGKTPDKTVEERRIQEILDEIELYFRERGHDISKTLRLDIDILTKRVTDTDAYPDDTNYLKYIKRLADDAEKRKVYRAVRVKLADLFDNSDPERNRARNIQKPKDRARLRRYGKAIGYLTSRFPEIKLRTAGPANRPAHHERPKRIDRPRSPRSWEEKGPGHEKGPTSIEEIWWLTKI